MKKGIFLFGSILILFWGGCSWDYFSEDLSEEKAKVTLSKNKINSLRRKQTIAEQSRDLTREAIGLLRDKKYTQAQKLFHTAYTMDSSNTEAKKGIAATKKLIDSKSKASDGSDAQYSDILTTRGITLMEHKKYKEALKMFTKALETNTKNTIAKRKKEIVERILNQQ